MKKIIFCLLMGHHDRETLEIKVADYYGQRFLSECGRCR